MSDLLRLYLDPSEIGDDGYPHAWHKQSTAPLGRVPDAIHVPAIKHFIRSLANNRCVRCHHPFIVGETPGRWSPCDDRCTHGLPIRRNCAGYLDFTVETLGGRTAGDVVREAATEKVPVSIEAEWRVLTVHHLNGIKYDCRWWNLASLCQRCHLVIQGKVYMERRWNREHTEWFKPYVAGYYASTILGEELSREEVMSRLDELLDLELTQRTLEGWD